MNNNERETLLVLLSRCVRFATEHPYAATWAFGAGMGSGATYYMMNRNSRFSYRVGNIFTPKVYEFFLTPEDLRRMIVDPYAEIRKETVDMVIVVTTEKRQQLKELPDIEG